MKKLILLSVTCCTLLLSGCNRVMEVYNASVSEYHFENVDNAVSVKAVLKTINLMWNGDWSFKGLEREIADSKASIKYTESMAAIVLHSGEMEEYFQANDYFIYTLSRITGQDTIVLQQTKFYVDQDGDLASTEIYNALD